MGFQPEFTLSCKFQRKWELNAATPSLWVSFVLTFYSTWFLPRIPNLNPRASVGPVYFRTSWVVLELWGQWNYAGVSVCACGVSSIAGHWLLWRIPPMLSLVTRCVSNLSPCSFNFLRQNRGGGDCKTLPYAPSSGHWCASICIQLAIHVFFLISIAM